MNVRWVLKDCFGIFKRKFLRKLYTLVPQRHPAHSIGGGGGGGDWLVSGGKCVCINKILMDGSVISHTTHQELCSSLCHGALFVIFGRMQKWGKFC